MWVRRLTVGWMVWHLIDNRHYLLCQMSPRLWSNSPLGKWRVHPQSATCPAPWYPVSLPALTGYRPRTSCLQDRGISGVYSGRMSAFCPGGKHNRGLIRKLILIVHESVIMLLYLEMFVGAHSAQITSAYSWLRSWTNVWNLKPSHYYLVIVTHKRQRCVTESHIIPWKTIWYQICNETTTAY